VAAADAAGAPQAGASGSGGSPSATLRVTLSCQDIVEAPEDVILVVGRYANTPLTGAVGAIDEALDGMFKNWVAMGMFNSELGELFYVPLPTANPKIKAKAVIIAGMGETGRFSREDLSYLMTNVGFAALQLQMPHLATVLIGTDGNVMTTERSLGAIIDGLRAALARYRKTPRKAKDGGEELNVEIFELHFDKYRQLYGLLKDMDGADRDGVQLDTKKLNAPPPELEQKLALNGAILALGEMSRLVKGQFSHGGGLATPLASLEVTGFLKTLSAHENPVDESTSKHVAIQGRFKDPVKMFERVLTSKSSVEGEAAPQQSSRFILRMTVTADVQRHELFEPKPGGARQAANDSSANKPAGTPATQKERTTDRIVFRYSALSDSAVIPLREVEIQPYFFKRLPRTLVGARTFEKQTFYGLTLATYLLPPDFRRLIESGQKLTLALDSTTAVFPWEMAAVHGQRDTLFLGSDLCLTRQFRTLNSATRGIAPPVDGSLNVLIIADPNTWAHPLVDAREEAVDLVDLFADAQSQRKWLHVKLTVRIGEDQAPWNDKLDKDGKMVEGYGLWSRLKAIKDRVPDLTLDIGTPVEGKPVEGKPCQPEELLGLLLNEHYDVVHYSGHATYDPRSGQKGWILRDDCILSATEILKTRNVPRLVFANACKAATVDSSGEQLPEFERMSQYVSQVEAFFARGLPNYIGPGWGWEVPSKQAREFAKAFYREALGVISRENPGLIACFGDAMAAARKKSKLIAQDKDKAEANDEARIWCAFQHYGQFDARLITPPRDFAES